MYSGWQSISTFGYDGPAGNRTSMTSPAVPGYPNGRTTTTTYTTATTAAVGGGVTPAGLPLILTSSGGAQQRTEYNAAGDAVRVTDPAGLVTELTYDGLGRVTSKKVLAPGYPSGLVTTYRYELDQMVETTDPSTTDAVTGAQHTLRTTDVMDADGNVLSRTAADTTGGDSSRVVTSEYNAYGAAQSRQATMWLPRPADLHAEMRGRHPLGIEPPRRLVAVPTLPAPETDVPATGHSRGIAGS